LWGYLELDGFGGGARKIPEELNKYFLDMTWDGLYSSLFNIKTEKNQLILT